MKFYMITTFLAASLSIPVASAQYLALNDMPINIEEGYKSSWLAESLVTVKEANELHDDAYVKMRGQIIKPSGGDRYIFRDDTDEITIEIENNIWRGLNIDANDVVEIIGKVDKEEGSIEIDVDYIVRVQ